MLDRAAGAEQKMSCVMPIAGRRRSWVGYRSRLGTEHGSISFTAAADVDPALASTEEFEDKNPLSCHRVRIANRATDMFFSAMCGLDIADEEFGGVLPQQS